MILTVRKVYIYIYREREREGERERLSERSFVKRDQAFPLCHL